MMLNTDRELPISALSVALANKLVALHQGSMNLVSEEGHGTRFDIWLPLGQVENGRIGAEG